VSGQSLPVALFDRSAPALHNSPPPAKMKKLLIA
jgi:hypothetical protein